MQSAQEKSLNHMTTRTSSRRSKERVSPLQETVTAALDDMKAVNVKVLDVRGLTDIADTMVIASGNSDRHVRSIAERVIEKARSAGFRPLGTEGARDGEWVLVDLQDIEGDLLDALRDGPTVLGLDGDGLENEEVESSLG